MKPPQEPLDYYAVFLLPKNEQELTRAGIILYLIGLFCTFVFFSQFNILSIDMIKPQCIIIGLYVWLYAVVIPRLILLLLWRFNFTRAWFGHLLGFLGLIGSQLLLFACLSWDYLVWKMLFGSLIVCLYYADLKKVGWKLAPKAIRNYLFIPALAVVFSLMLLSSIPLCLGGTKPGKVFVVFKGTDLLKSRFVKNDGHYNLLYETGTDYYFLESLKDAANGNVFGYQIKRVTKSEILKMEFKTNVWLDF